MTYNYPDYDEVARIERQARKMQAEAMSIGVRSLVRGIGSMPGALSGLFARRVHH